MQNKTTDIAKIAIKMALTSREEEINLSNMEIELLLKDLWKTGFLIDFLDSYGIKEKLVL